jgi:hypothetical protein
MFICFVLPLLRLGLDYRPVLVRFVVDKVKVGQVCLVVLVFCHVSITPPVLHTSATNVI